MKKYLLLLLTLLLVCVLFAGCECDHEWTAADCENAKVCKLCGLVEGEAAGHKWDAASCEAPKTCSVCKKTEGEAAGHQWTEASCEVAKTCTVCNKTVDAALGHDWAAASCETAKTCSICKKTEGEALGHQWAEASCEAAKTCSVCSKVEGEALGHQWLPATTEAPKTCSVCGKTEGEKLPAPSVGDDRFNTEACKHLFGTWKGDVYIPAEDFLGEALPGVDMDLLVSISMTFRENGTMVARIVLDEESYKAVLRPYTIEMTYQMYEGFGMSRDQADAAMMAEMGVDIPGYVDMMLEEMDSSEFNQVQSGVYYVENGLIYGAVTWEDEFEALEAEVTADTISTNIEGISLVLTRSDETEEDKRELFDPAACAHLFGTWIGELEVDMATILGETIQGVPSMSIKAEMRVSFHEDGSMKTSLVLDRESYMAAMRTYTIEVTYQTYEQMGLSRDEADAAVKAELGVDIPGYVDMILTEIDEEMLTQSEEGIYYVQDGKLYTGPSWEEDTTTDDAWVEGSELTILLEDPFMQVTLTKQN